MSATLAENEKRSTLLYQQGDSFIAQAAMDRVKFSHSMVNGHDQLHVSNMPIFRSGTFRDSWGEEATWTPFHIQQMVQNFQFLKSTRVFEDVPVRKGHPSFLGGNTTDELIGYVSDLRAEEFNSPIDGETHTYLISDFDILDEVAKGKIESGLWRNRSSEVGYFGTNDNAEYWPTLVGFAYVDIPAVQGLNFSKDAPESKKFSILVDQKIQKEDSAVDPSQQQNNNQGTPPAPPAPPAPPVDQTQNHQNPPAPPAPPAQPFVFKIAGQDVTDFSRVQAHITALETAQNEAMQANRKAFVASLSDNNKILASQKEEYEKFALAMTPEQYTAWETLMNNAPAQSVLGAHKVGDPNGGQSGQSYGTPPAPGTPNQTEIDKQIVAQHRLAGMSQDTLAKTDSYRRLVAAGVESA